MLPSDENRICVSLPVQDLSRPWKPELDFQGSPSSVRAHRLPKVDIMAILSFFNTLSARQDVSEMDLSHIPVVQPPEGVTPYFVNPPSLATAHRVIIYIFMPLMSALVVVRLGTRLRQMQKLVADDSAYTIMIAAFSRPLPSTNA